MGSSCWTLAYKPPTIPCNSVNSFTNSVVRSVFASSAALWTTPDLTDVPALRSAAEIFLKGDGLQHVHAPAQWNFLVSFPEESRVVEAGAQHALVTVANHPVG